MFENNRYDLTRIPYGRRGTFFYLAAYEENGREVLYACALFSGLDTAAPGQTARCGKLFPITIERDGVELPYHAEATPVCVTLTYDGGTARLCLQEDSILRIEATGADIVIPLALNPHEIAKDRNDGSWEVIMNPLPKLLFCPVGGELAVKTGFNVVNSQPEDTSVRATPDATGKAGMAIHMYRSNGRRLAAYPAFDSCLAAIEQEFSAYLETIPKLSDEFADARIIEAFIIWSHTIPIDGTDIIYMNKGIHRTTSSWQQSYHAMGQYQNPRYAWQLLLSVFRYQDEYGMLPDCIFDSYQSFGGCKPPFQGVAIEFLKEHTNFDFAPRSEWLTLYNGLSQLVFWWLSYRDTDNDGIAQYDTADESGWDDCSMFKVGGAVETPDLSAYIILSMDNLAEIAGRLGKTYEQREWKRRADAMLQEMIALFWNGEQFCGRTNQTHAWADGSSIINFIPLLLGERLPQEIRDKLAETLSQEGKWLSPYGLAGERMDGPHYHETGWAAGPVLGPAQLLVCLGLRASGKTELAREIALRYCRALKAANFPMVLSATTGQDTSEGRWGPRYPNRMAWTAAIFLLLGSLFS